MPQTSDVSTVWENVKVLLWAPSSVSAARLLTALPLTESVLLDGSGGGCTTVRFNSVLFIYFFANFTDSCYQSEEYRNSRGSPQPVLFFFLFYHPTLVPSRFCGSWVSCRKVYSSVKHFTPCRESGAIIGERWQHGEVSATGARRSRWTHDNFYRFTFRVYFMLLAKMLKERLSALATDDKGPIVH